MRLLINKYAAGNDLLVCLHNDIAQIYEKVFTFLEIFDIKKALLLINKALELNIFDNYSTFSF
jgi:hypothetical protein